MEKIVIAPEYDAKYIQTGSPKPLSSKKLEDLIHPAIQEARELPLPFDEYAERFKDQFQAWVFGSKLNKYTGIENFKYRDLAIGCTQYIDNLYIKYGMRGLQLVENDYTYHKRLNPDPVIYADHDHMLWNKPLLVSLPFPYVGDKLPYMDRLLDKCLASHVDVHIDGAWMTCSRDVEFDFSHPAIKTIGISLSKGLGLGWNRVAVRYSREKQNDSISIMNDFNMNCKGLPWVAKYYLDNCEPDYLWNNFGEYYYKVCKDFDLIPTKCIHIALNDQGHPRGIAPLIRYLDLRNTASGM